jgi:hypothetical protein
METIPIKSDSISLHKLVKTEPVGSRIRLEKHLALSRSFAETLEPISLLSSMLSVKSVAKEFLAEDLGRIQGT